MKNSSRRITGSRHGVGFLAVAVLFLSVMGSGCQSEGPVGDDGNVLTDVTPPQISDVLPDIPLSDSWVRVTIIDPAGSDGAPPSGLIRPGISATADDGVDLDVELSGTNHWNAKLSALEDGPHTILWSATDLAGNTTTALQPITVDRTPPAVTVLSSPSPNGSSSRSTVDLEYTFTVEDPHFDHVTVSAYDCGLHGLPGEVPWPEGSGPGEVEHQSQTLTTPGASTVTFRFHSPDTGSESDVLLAHYCFVGIAQDGARDREQRSSPNIAEFLTVTTGQDVFFTWTR